VPNKIERLEADGWRVGNVEDFLGLSPEEATFIELKLALASRLKTVRRRRHLTQAQAAKMVASSQSRVAKMEAGDPSVSMDLLVRSLLAMGASREELASAMAPSP
jgi:DNA-binding XRE family transcriptional regulator